MAADSGMMGGSLNHEFLAVSPVGEDTLLICTEYVQLSYNFLKKRCRERDKEYTIEAFYLINQ